MHFKDITTLFKSLHYCVVPLISEDKRKNIFIYINYRFNFISCFILNFIRSNNFVSRYKRKK